jgi:chorismate mutase
MKITLLGNLDLNKIGERLKIVDHFLLHILKVRLANGGLSDYVAEVKRLSSPDGVFQKRRQAVEDNRITMMKKWAKENGLDSNFSASIMYQIIAESCRVQDEIMVEKIRNKEKTINETNEELIYKHQKQNLLELTNAVAENYDKNYAEGFFGTKLYSTFEKKVIYELMSELEDKSLAIDLGCGTGIVSFEISPHFKKVIGYDISPQMISVSNKKNTNNKFNIEFIEADIEKKI